MAIVHQQKCRSRWVFMLNLGLGFPMQLNRAFIRNYLVEELLTNMKLISLDEMIFSQQKLLGLFSKYYSKVADVMTPLDLYKSLYDRMATNDAILIVWGDFEGFITCDFKENPIKKRKEAVVWTVYNPKPEYKQAVLEMLQHQAEQRGMEAIVFFAEDPIAFNKLVKDYGYQCTLGYFEKQLKGVN
jgi:hypothetical protein